MDRDGGVQKFQKIGQTIFLESGGLAGRECAGVDGVDGTVGDDGYGSWRRWDSDSAAAAGKLAEWREKSKRLAAESCRRADIFKSHFGKRGQV